MPSALTAATSPFHSWKDKEVFITFEGVYSAMYLWINGKKLGYSQGPTTDARFDITKSVRPSKNVVAVEVYRWSDDSYIKIRTCSE